MPSAPTKPRLVDTATAEERAAAGKEARAKVSRASHGEWEPPARRRDPVKVLEDQAETRVQELVPIRYGRMLVSPFTFYRGAAAIMAIDLANTPRLRAAGPGLRRRPPVELRRVRRPGPPPGLRRQRLRRDAARPLGMGRQAPRGELRGRRARPRLHPDARPATAVLDHGPRLPRGDARVRDDAKPRRLVRAPRRREPARPTSAKVADKKQMKAVAEERRQGPTRRTACKAFDRLVRVVDGEPQIISDPPLLVPAEELLPKGEEREIRGADPRDAPPLPREPQGRPPTPLRQLPVRRDGSQGGRGRKRRHPCLGAS